VPSDADVVAVDTDSRGLGPVAAAQQVRIAATRLRSLGATAWFKKVDSTLRGNVSAELGALIQAGGYRLAVLAPSFPANQRHVEDGWLLVGEPPERRLQLVPLLAPAFPGRVVAIRLRHVARSAPELAESLRAQVESAPLLALVDALDDRDLETIVRAAELLAPTALLAGSGGLSAALAARRGQRGLAVRVRTGSDTAAAVCRALCAECLDLGGEVLPGMPTGTLLGGRRPWLRIVTKSGGFGPPDALVRAVEALGATTDPAPALPD